jgi:small neutral amino acid transporter SnatA (MarC family)
MLYSILLYFDILFVVVINKFFSYKLTTRLINAINPELFNKVLIYEIINAFVIYICVVVLVALYVLAKDIQKALDRLPRR